MSLGTDYQRYKQKLERLQSKVKRSENARKELEIRLQRLMKERNECEKTASIHKSKYDTLLNHERKRLSRNEELLQMLEDVQAKASHLASNTERLKILKNQQERILINNWRRNACLQSQIFYPNVFYPDTVQYVLPSQPPLASTSSSSSAQPAMVAHDYRSPAIVRPSNFVETPNAIYRNPNEEHSSRIQTFIDTSNAAAQQPIISQNSLKLGSSSLMPIYQSEPFHPMYNNFYIRSHEPNIKPNDRINEPANISNPTILTQHVPSVIGQSSFQQNAFIPDRIINKDMTNLHIGYDKNANPLQSYGNFTPRIGQRLRDSSQFPLHLNEIQQYGHQYNSPIESINRNKASANMEPRNQFPFGDGSKSSQINVPSHREMVREFTHSSHQMNETIPMNSTASHQQAHEQHSRNKSNTDPTIYGGGVNVTDMFGNANSNASDIDSLNQYEQNTNDECNEPFKRVTNDDDVYANDNEFKPTYIESIDLRKSITTTASASTATPLMMAAAPTTKYMHTDFTNENVQHVPYAASTSTIDDIPNERDHYPYESISDRTYTSIHPKDANSDNIDRTHIDDVKRVTANISNVRTLFPKENEERITRFNEKRRSSIDADSFAKTLGYENNLEKESIAANLRRRYSVAANFLNLPSNSNSFRFTTTASDNDRRNDTRAWINNNNNNTLPTRTNTIEPEQIDSIRNHGLNKKSSFDMNSMSTIENQIDMPLASSSTISQLPNDNNQNYLNEQSNIGPNQEDQNIGQYENGTTPFTTTTSYVEHAMEQLKLDNDDDDGDNNSERRFSEEIKPIQLDDVNGMDRNRASGKTVTWADDPQNNYKKQEQTASVYEAQNMANDDNTANPYYTNQSESQPIQQTDYVTIDGNGAAADTNETQQYQYDNGQYQYQEPTTVGNQNLYTNNDYYYDGTEQINQYDQQYAAQSESQSQDTQQMPYYTTDATEINDGSGNNDGYQQFQTETTLQVQPKQDEYYTVSPGENYYTDYENVNENRTYGVPSNVGAVEQQPQQQSNALAQQEPIHIPNYLQSDTDDSQAGYQNQTSNNAPQSQDSDFDFSTNS